ncbi:MAG: ATP-binding cassette domain-containing protein, partial [Ligilactobacillus salivarius]|nr:ATP-binding cassette domain-containing protein [Ligilactobacillus salivarius]
QAKRPQDYHQFFDEWSEHDIATMVRRDRNHPSIIMWSIGNEIAERADEPTGEIIARKLIATIHKYDTSRATTAAVNSFWDRRDFSWEKDSERAFRNLDVSGYNYQWKEYEKQQVKIQKLEDFVNKNLVRASTTKRAQSKRKQLEKMDRLERPEGEEKGPHFKFHANKESGNVVLKVTDAAIGYDSKVISNPITFELRKHHAMAIVGPNGIGKSTLLKSILGNIPFIHGSATFGTNVQTGYYDQEQQNLHDKKTVLNEIWDDHPNMLEKDVRSLLGSFLFVGDDVKKVVHNLSGGEKARLTLTKLALQEDNFLMLDEPTNHLDIDSKEVLESALIDFEGTILFVSHDRYFINQVADTVLEITPEGSNLYLGNYDYYLEKKAELEAIEAAKEAEQSQDDQQVSKTSQKQLNYKKSKELQKQQRKLQRLVDDAESEMERLEELKANIEQEMTLPDNFNDPQKMDTLHTKLSKATNDLNEAESKWTELSLELEELQ